MDIKKEDWMICKICGFDIKKDSYKKSGVYNTTKFIEHLKTHGVSLEQYFIDKCGYEKLICPCGVCNKELKITKKEKSNFKWFNMACGRNRGLLKWSEKAKTSRLGKNNPMYGVPAWNKNKTKNNNEILRKMSESQKGKKIPIEAKIKMSESAKKRKIHGHTGKKHSEENKLKFRLSTLNMIKEGRFPQTNTLPHRKFRELLEKHGFVFEEEKIIGYYSFDFYLPSLNMFIEIDGDYFHSNPKIYSNGPKTKTQKINHFRDYKKNEFCQQNNIKLIRIWESDILNSNGEELLWKLKILSL